MPFGMERTRIPGGGPGYDRELVTRAGVELVPFVEERLRDRNLAWLSNGFGGRRAVDVKRPVRGTAGEPVSAVGFVDGTSFEEDGGGGHFVSLEAVLSTNGRSCKPISNPDTRWSEDCTSNMNAVFSFRNAQIPGTIARSIKLQ